MYMILKNEYQQCEFEVIKSLLPRYKESNGEAD
jgi:hypothetical protein